MGKHSAEEPNPQSELGYVCPTCKAAIGEFCTTRTGNRVPYGHEPRQRLWGTYKYNHDREEGQRRAAAHVASLELHAKLTMEAIWEAQHRARMARLREMREQWRQRS